MSRLFKTPPGSYMRVDSSPTSILRMMLRARDEYPAVHRTSSGGIGYILLPFSEEGQITDQVLHLAETLELQQRLDHGELATKEDVLAYLVTIPDEWITVTTWRGREIDCFMYRAWELVALNS